MSDTINNKKLELFFSRDPRVINTNVRKQKKLIKNLIVNHLNNIERKLKGVPEVKFEDEFLVTTTKKRTSIKKYVRMNTDVDWATKILMSELGYDTYLVDNYTAYNIKLLKEEFVKKYTKLRKVGNVLVTEDMIINVCNNVLDKTYPKEYGLKELRNSINGELIKKELKLYPRKKRAKADVIPTQVSLEVYKIYSDKMFKKYGKSDKVKNSIIRFILNSKKHNGMTIKDAEKLIKMNISEYKKEAVEIKKSLNALISAGTV
jgi:hypothetical protein